MATSTVSEKVPTSPGDDKREFSPSLSPAKTDHGATGDSCIPAKTSTSKTKPKTTKTAAAASNSKPAAAAKPRKAATHAALDHPKYAVMLADAITQQKERNGSSRQAILKFIVNKYRLGEDLNMINVRLKWAIKAGIKSGSLKQTKGKGASGSFQLAKAPGRGAAAEKANKPRWKAITKIKVKKPAASTSGKAKAAAKPLKKPVKKEAKAGKSPAGKKTTTKAAAAAAKVWAGASRPSKAPTPTSGNKRAKAAKSPEVQKAAAAGKNKSSVKKAPGKTSAAKVGRPKGSTKKAASK